MKENVKKIKINVAAYAMADFLHMCQCSDIDEVAFTKEDNESFFVINKKAVDKALYKYKKDFNQVAQMFEVNPGSWKEGAIGGTNLLGDDYERVHNDDKPLGAPFHDDD